MHLRRHTEHPKNQDVFAQPDLRPPLLEIVPARRAADGSPHAISDGGAPALGALGEYVLTLPVSWFLHSVFVENLAHARVDFIVRRRASTQEPLSILEPANEPTPGIIYVVDPVIEATRWEV